jgi:hypothetical protein
LSSGVLEEFSLRIMYEDCGYGQGYAIFGDDGNHSPSRAISKCDSRRPVFAVFASTDSKSPISS